MTKLRAIVVGSGWGAHAARAFAEHDNVELCGIVGRGSERTVRLAKLLDVPVYADLRAAVAEHRPALAVVAIHETAHREIALMLLESGAHLLCAHPVAPSADIVLEIVDCARRVGRLARTDYSFRIRPELHAIAGFDPGRAPMRLTIEAPGRWLPIALDTAVQVAGPVARVLATRRYPSELEARAERRPEAFPPSVVLEHRGGTVTAITPVPHAWPAAPVRVIASFERGRVEALLPRGGARALACRRAGVVRDEELVPPSADASDAGVHGRGMQELASAFVDSLLAGEDVLATLDDEAHLRIVWSALWRAAKVGGAVEVVAGPRA